MFQTLHYTATEATERWNIELNPRILLIPPTNLPYVVRDIGRGAAEVRAGFAPGEAFHEAREDLPLALFQAAAEFDDVGVTVVYRRITGRDLLGVGERKASAQAGAL